MTSIAIGGIIIAASYALLILNLTRDYKHKKLKDKDLSSYRKLLELYAKENGLINPADVEFSKFTINIFNKLEDKNKIFIKNKLLHEFEDFEDYDSIEKIVEKGGHIEHCILYKNKIIGFYNPDNMTLVDNGSYIPLSLDGDTSHDNYYIQLILAYNSGIFSKIDHRAGINKMMRYISEKYPEHMTTVKDMIKKTKITRYNKIHTETIHRLESGEITVELAKEINDLAFDKYITESKVLASAAILALLGGAIILDRRATKKEEDKQKLRDEQKNQREVNHFVDRMNKNNTVFTLNGNEIKFDSIDDIYDMVINDVKKIINFIKSDSDYKHQIKSWISEEIERKRDYLLDKDDSDIDKKIQEYKNELTNYKLIVKPEKHSNDLDIEIICAEQSTRSILWGIITDIDKVIKTKYKKVFDEFNLSTSCGDGDEGYWYVFVNKKKIK